MHAFRNPFTLLLLTMIAGLSLAAHAQLAERRILTTEAVKNIMAAAEAEARSNNWNVVIAIVDEGGHLLSLLRLDDTQTASIDIAIGKARTAAAFRRPSMMFEEAVTNRPALLTVQSGLVMMEGGVPIVVDGRTIGAVGVSGVTSAQDAQIAQAGIAALEQ